METNNESYVLEYWTNAGKFYKEFTRAEAIEYIKSKPEFLTRRVGYIIDICEKSRKNKDEYLRYDIEAIYDNATCLLEVLNLLKDEN